MRISDSLDLPQLLDDAGMCWDWEEVATMDRGEIEWTPQRWRSAVTQLEEHLEESGRVLVGKDTEELCPITNSFGDGCYVREWLCPPGVFTISRIHRFAHPFFVLEGEVSIYKETTDAERLHLSTLQAGSYLGEMAILTDEPRSATVVATRPSRLLSLRGERLKELILDMPEISFELMRVLTGRVRTVEQRLAELSPANAGEAPPAPAPPAAVKT